MPASLTGATSATYQHICGSFHNAQSWICSLQGRRRPHWRTSRCTWARTPPGSASRARAGRAPALPPSSQRRRWRRSPTRRRCVDFARLISFRRTACTCLQECIASAADRPYSRCPRHKTFSHCCTLCAQVLQVLILVLCRSTCHSPGTTIEAFVDLCLFPLHRTRSMTSSWMTCPTWPAVWAASGDRCRSSTDRCPASPRRLPNPSPQPSAASCSFIAPASAVCHSFALLSVAHHLSKHTTLYRHSWRVMV